MRFGISVGIRSCCRRGTQGGTFWGFWLVFSVCGCPRISASAFIFLFTNLPLTHYNYLASSNQFLIINNHLSTHTQ
jgi:hypothetical protein